MSSCQYFSCLYTKHKTQKKKVWQDGKLKVSKSGTISIYDVGSKIISGNDSVPIDTLCIHISQVSSIKAGSELESEKFLVTVESEWQQQQNQDVKDLQNNSESICTRDIICTTLNKKVMLKSQDGMKKLQANKFRRPTKFIPGQHRSKNNHQMIRKAPLQPGEYIQQFQSQNIINAKDDLSHHHHGQQSYSTSQTQPRSPTHQNITVDPRHKIMPYQEGNLTSDVFHGPNQCLKTMQSATNTQQAFVSNDFDPNSFYAESDNDDDDQTEDVIADDMFRINPLTSNKENYATDISARHLHINPRIEAVGDHQNNNLHVVKDRLSKSELMDLFESSNNFHQSDNEENDNSTFQSVPEKDSYDTEEDQSNDFLKGLLQHDAEMVRSKKSKHSSITWDRDINYDQNQDFCTHLMNEIDSTETKSVQKHDIVDCIGISDEIQDNDEVEKEEDINESVTFSITVESSSEEDSDDSVGSDS